MSRIIGIILLLGAIFIISIIGKTVPGNPTTARPSETTVPQTNINYSTPSAGGTAISNPSKSEATPLSQRVSIGSASVFVYPKEYSRITLNSRLKEGETVNITGWKIKSNKNEIIIPQAIEIYDPGGFGKSGDLILKPDNYADLYSLASPFDRNIRLNKCIGYLKKIYNFDPIYLPQNCPYFSGADIRQLSGQCQDYIQRLPSCEYPDVGFYNLLPGTDEGNTCRAFLQNIGYGGCFRGHQQDKDFLSDNWIVWLDEQIIDPRHDYLRLYDKEGNLVSEYNY